MDDPFLIKCYGQNIMTIHLKLESIPIGIANEKWSHGNEDVFKEVSKYSGKYSIDGETVSLEKKTTYDYSECNCEELNQIYKQISELKAKAKPLESRLNLLTLHKLEVDELTGEVITLYPPKSTTTEFLKFKLK
jgi:hypothetical protein